MKNHFAALRAALAGLKANISYDIRQLRDPRATFMEFVSDVSDSLSYFLQRYRWHLRSLQAADRRRKGF